MNCICVLSGWLVKLFVNKIALTKNCKRQGLCLVRGVACNARYFLPFKVVTCHKDSSCRLEEWPHSLANCPWLRDHSDDLLASVQVSLVYGQMNEPPGARARVALTGLSVAEYFRDQEGQDVLLFIDNIFR